MKFFILFYSILFHSIPFHSIPFHSIPFYSILFYSILFYSILFYSSIHPSIHISVRWIEIYPVNSAIQPLNNQDQVNKTRVKMNTAQVVDETSVTVNHRTTLTQTIMLHLLMLKTIILSWLFRVETNCLLVTRFHRLCSWSTIIHSWQLNWLGSRDDSAAKMKEHWLPLESSLKHSLPSKILN